MYKRRARLLGLLVCIIMGLSVGFPMVVYAEQYEYDELNRVTKAIYEDGSYVTYEYDANGNITDIASYDSGGQLVTSEPVEPDESTEPTEPSEPTDPEEPIEPSDPPTFTETVVNVINRIVSVIKEAVSKIFGIFRRG